MALATEHQRVPFRLLQCPECGAMLCWVNPRLPNYCPECGEHVYSKIRGCVMANDDDAMLTTKITIS